MPAAPDLRLGIDVGGTNTDAVVLDRDDRVLARAKAPTTADVTAASRGDRRGARTRRRWTRDRITHVMLGTTHATNAVLERRHLQRVAVLRIGAPGHPSVRPLFGLARRPARRGLGGRGDRRRRDRVRRPRASSPSTPRPSPGSSRRVAGTAEAVAITGVFSPVSPRTSWPRREVARKKLGDDVHDLAQPRDRLDRPARARERHRAQRRPDRRGPRRGRRAAGGARRATGCDAGHVLRPERRHADGPGLRAALPGAHDRLRPGQQLRGAAFLTGPRDALVADVGGTSTDVGVLVGGFPRESAAAVEIGGIRTNFRMPDLVTIALGGGTVVASRRRRGPGRPARASATGSRERGADVRRATPHADRRRRRRRAAPTWARCRPAPTRACCAAGLERGRRDARRRDRPGEDRQPASRR